MCAAPPVQDWQAAARQLQEDGWDLHAIPTQTAASWLDLGSLAAVTGHAVRTRPRLPHETDELPPADAVLVAPATFNTVNQWAAGINDTLPLGALNELLGLNVPIVVAMYCKAALATHPAYRPNIRRLAKPAPRFLKASTRSPSAMTVSPGPPSGTHSERCCANAPIVTGPSPGNARLLQARHRGALLVLPRSNTRATPLGVMVDRLRGHAKAIARLVLRPSGS